MELRSHEIVPSKWCATSDLELSALWCMPERGIIDRDVSTRGSAGKRWDSTASYVKEQRKVRVRYTDNLKSIDIE